MLYKFNQVISNLRLRGEQHEKESIKLDTAPIAGKLPENCLTTPTVVAVPAGAVELVADSIGWRTEGGYDVSGSFEAGKRYYFVACLKCKDGYYFPGSGGGYEGTASVNGAEVYYAEINNAGEGNRSTYAYIGIVLTTDGIVSVMPGDVDGNGSVNDTDLTMLLRYVAKIEPSLTNSAAADMNNDGKIDAVDVTLLAKYLESIA